MCLRFSERLTYSCARYVFALLVVFDTALVDEAVSSGSAFSFDFDAVGIQLYRGGDMHLHQICLSSDHCG